MTWGERTSDQQRESIDADLMADFNGETLYDRASSTSSEFLDTSDESITSNTGGLEDEQPETEQE